MLAAIRRGAATVIINRLGPSSLLSADAGPFAKPTRTEKLEHLLTRVPRADNRKKYELHALEHVLSFQRRNAHFKRTFLTRGKKSPLGVWSLEASIVCAFRAVSLRWSYARPHASKVTRDFWDRTEAQQRGTLHSSKLNCDKT